VVGAAASGYCEWRIVSPNVLSNRAFYSPVVGAAASGYCEWRIVSPKVLSNRDFDIFPFGHIVYVTVLLWVHTFSLRNDKNHS
jgi:hypothetical protein